MGILALLVHPRLMAALGALTGITAGFTLLAGPFPSAAANAWAGICLFLLASGFVASACRNILSGWVASSPWLAALLTPLVVLPALLLPLFGLLLAIDAPEVLKTALYGAGTASLLSWLSVSWRLVTGFGKAPTTTTTVVPTAVLYALGQAVGLAAAVPGVVATGLLAEFASMVLFENAQATWPPITEIASAALAVSMAVWRSMTLLQIVGLAGGLIVPPFMYAALSARTHRLSA